MAEGTEGLKLLGSTYKFGDGILSLDLPSEPRHSITVGCEETNAGFGEGYACVTVTLCEGLRLADALEQMARAIRDCFPTVLADGVSTKEASL
jgi:hypothetical protein